MPDIFGNAKENPALFHEAFNAKVLQFKGYQFQNCLKRVVVLNTSSVRCLAGAFKIIVVVNTLFPKCCV